MSGFFGVLGVFAQSTDWGDARMVANLRTFEIGSNPNGFAVAGDLVLFSAQTDEGVRFFRTDGTPRGTGQIELETPDDSRVSLDPLASVGAFALFLSNREEELWTSDGSAAETRMLLSTEGEFIFRCKTDYGVLLSESVGEDWYTWITDGTSSGTRKLVELDRPLGNCFKTPMGLFLTLSRKVADGTWKSQLWRTDATAQGTQFTGHLPELAGTPTAIGEHVVFAAYGDRCCQKRLGAFTPESGNTEYLTAPGGFSEPYSLAGRLVAFEAQADGMRIWETDGTPAGTAAVGTVPGIEWLEVVGRTDEVLFLRAYTSETGRELWRSDGTVAGTFQLVDMNPGSDSPDLEILSVAGGRIYFHGWAPDIGTELWISDGTVAGTYSMDLFPGPIGSTPCFAVAAHGGVYVSAFLRDVGNEPVFIDPITREYRVLADLRSGADFGSRPSFLGVVDSELLFSAQGDEGRKFWRTDGTREGTVVFEPPVPSSSTSFYSQPDGGLYARFRSPDYAAHSFWDLSQGSPKELLNGREWPAVGFLGDRLLVAGDDHLFVEESGSMRPIFNLNRRGTYGHVVSGERLSFVRVSSKDGWIATDGTSEFTWLLPFTGSASRLGEGVVLGDALLVAEERDGVSGLWRIHPTSGGRPELLLQTAPLDSRSNQLPEDFTLFGDLLYFETDSGPWRTDGTPEGTKALFTHIPWEGTYTRFYPRPVGGHLYFTLGSWGLWAVSGEGASPVRVLNSHQETVRMIGEADGRLLVAADDADHGKELWTVDGTTAWLEADLASGPTSSSPTAAIQVGDHLFVSANVPPRGEELWVLSRRSEQPASEPRLGLPYPNPANAYFDVPYIDEAAGSLVLYDLLGRRVQTLASRPAESAIRVSTANLSNGVYFLRVESGSSVPETRRVVVAR